MAHAAFRAAVEKCPASRSRLPPSGAQSLFTLQALYPLAQKQAAGEGGGSCEPLNAFPRNTWLFLARQEVFGSVFTPHGSPRGRV